MQRALELAATQRGITSPDPMVGAVLVKNDKVIAEGYHGPFTTPHAETWAIEKAGQRAAGATLYINLEPCNHFGNNPPCTENIIRAKIKKIVAAMQDPNPLVSGKGFATLKKAKIKVVVGLLAPDAKKLNEFFIKHITTGLPFVILKAAASLDGKIATHAGDSRWISNLESRKLTHTLRNQVDAVMVGINTVLKDDPQLNVRLVKQIKNPLRIVLDANCKIPLNAKVLDTRTAPTLLACTRTTPKDKILALEKRGVEVMLVKAKSGKINLKALMTILGKRKITSVLIEGGSEVFTNALEEKIVDKIMVFIAPKLIGGAGAKTWFEGKGASSMIASVKLKAVDYRQIGEDMLVEGYL